MVGSLELVPLLFSAQLLTFRFLPFFLDQEARSSSSHLDFFFTTSQLLGPWRPAPQKALQAALGRPSRRLLMPDSSKTDFLGPFSLVDAQLAGPWRPPSQKALQAEGGLVFEVPHPSLAGIGSGGFADSSALTLAIFEASSEFARNRAEPRGSDFACPARPLTSLRGMLS
ncbi:hypothetical protein TYRP_022670 [Tyrophagus putrescentiae]|nr:hypothetical protein TYRP_022670 [Tyrophagus putrescentiae]